MLSSYLQTFNAETNLLESDRNNDFNMSLHILLEKYIVSYLHKIVSSRQRIDVSEFARAHMSVGYAISTFLQKKILNGKSSVGSNVSVFLECIEALKGSQTICELAADHTFEDIMGRVSAYLRKVNNSEYLVLRFILAVLIGDFEDACDLLLHHVDHLLSFIPSVCVLGSKFVRSTNYDKNVYSHEMKQLQLLVQLQTIVDICSQYVHSNNPEVSDPVSKALANCEIFIVSYSSILPIVSFAIRVGFAMLCIRRRPDVAKCLIQALRNHDYAGDNEGKRYCTFIKKHWIATESIIKIPESISADRSFGKHLSIPLTAQEVGLSANDEGVHYVYKVSREQANIILGSRAVGSFLVRPHDTLSDQFFLSFVSTTSGSAGGQNQESVKHAIIRKERILNLDDHSNVTLFTCGKIGPNDSLIAILRSISNVLSHPLLFQRISQDDVETGDKSKLSAVNLDLNSFLWKSFEDNIDKFAGMISISEERRSAIRRREDEISSFQRSPLNDRPFTSIAELMDKYKQNGDDGEDKLDEDDNSYETGDEVRLSDSDNRLSESERAEDSDEISSDLQRERSKKIAIAKAYYRRRRASHCAKDAILQLTIPVCPDWLVEKKSPFMFELIQRVTALQFAKEILHLNDSFMHVLKACLAMDLDNEVKREPNLTNSKLLKLIEKNWRSPLKTDIIRFDSSAIFMLLNQPLREYILSAEGLLKTMLCPPGIPRSIRFIPPPSNYPDPSSSAFHSNKTTHFLHSNLLEDSAERASELLLAETLLKLTMLSMPLKTVKLPGHGNGYGAIEHLVPDCLDMTNMQQLYARWYLITAQYNENLKELSLMNRPLSVNERKTGIIDQNNANNRANEKPPLTKMKSNSMSDLASLKKRSDSNNKSRFHKISSHLHIPSVLQASLSKVLAHHPSSSPTGAASAASGSKGRKFGKAMSSKRSKKYELIVKTINAINRLLQIDNSFDAPDEAKNIVSQTKPKDFADLYISWLSGLKTIHQVVKPPEHAFALPQMYYRYVDPWQVRVLVHYSLLEERCRLGRSYYTGVGVLSAGKEALNRSSDASSEGPIRVENADSTDACISSFGTVIESVLQLETLVTISSRSVNNSSGRDDRILDAAKKNNDIFNLWETVKGEQYLRGFISQLHPQQLRENDMRFAVGAYYYAIVKQLYRNALFCRLHMPYRFTAYIQVDLYHLKEVTRVSSVDDAELKSLGCSGNGNNNSGFQLLSKDAVLQPSQSIRASSIDVFSILRLGRKSTSARRRSDSVDQDSPSDFSKHSSMGSFMAAASSSHGGNVHGGSRTHLDGTAVTPCHKAEPGRGPSTPKESDGSSSPSRIYSQCGNNGTCVLSSSDYSWREQVLFRFALPEGIVALDNSFSNDSKRPRRARRNLNENGDDSTARFSADINDNFFVCPDTVFISVYERTFFSDNKLGDLQLNLKELTDKRVLKGWFPLVVDKSITWLLFLQVKLKFPLAVIDTPHHRAVGSANIFQRELDKANECNNVKVAPIQFEDLEQQLESSSPLNAPNPRSGNTTSSNPVKKKNISFLQQLEDFF